MKPVNFSGLIEHMLPFTINAACKFDVELPMTAWFAVYVTTKLSVDAAFVTTLSMSGVNESVVLSVV